MRTVSSTWITGACALGTFCQCDMNAGHLWREPQLRKCLRHLPAGTSVGHFVAERLMREGPEHCDLRHLWAAGPGLYEKAGSLSRGEQAMRASQQAAFFPWSLVWFLLELLPRDCLIANGHANQINPFVHVTVWIRRPNRLIYLHTWPSGNGPTWERG